MIKKVIAVLATIVLTCSTTSNVFAATTGDNINEGFTVPTQQEIIQSQQKEEKAREYYKTKLAKSSKATNGISPMSTGSTIINCVGTYRQELSYSCGPAASRNLITGYVMYFGGTCPSEATLRVEEQTTTGGTGFGSNIYNTLNKYAPGNNYIATWGNSTGWVYTMAQNIMYTLDKPGYYDVIADLYHGVTSTPINPIYANGIKHYVCVYGYNDTSKIDYISDSNSAAPVEYTTPYLNLANSTKDRGIIW